MSSFQTDGLPASRDGPIRFLRRQQDRATQPCVEHSREDCS